MDKEGLVYKVALSFLYGMGAVRVGQLVSKLDDISQVFTLKISELHLKTQISISLLKAMKREDALSRAKNEIDGIEKFNISVHFFMDPDYPRRLRQCSDAPVILYSKGGLDLNERRVVSIVGTRQNTEYGRELIQEFIKGINNPNLQIISGLALGIDALAHKNSLINSISTIGVLGHGLHEIFPQRHNKLASEMLEQGGGLLSEFPLFTIPIRENFPMRNRIIAGMADAIVVVESQVRGGSMITANLGNDYNRDVFAFPGSVRQQFSSGCNALIQQQKAHLITSSFDFLKFMNWEQKQIPTQKELAISLSLDEKDFIKCLSKFEFLHLDELVSKLGLPSSKLLGIALNLQMKNAIVSLPGNRFSVN